jgi:hypothetical protein
MPKCKICKSKFTPTRALQPTCNEYECKLAYAVEHANKAIERKKKAEKKVLKEKLKTLTQYESEAKKKFQRFIRKRDENLPCISCGTFQTDLWDGGHFKKAELYSGVIFDEMNCHRQCRKCNRFLGGNELNYREGLVKRYGIDYVLEIEERALRLKKHKYSREDLIALKNLYKEKIKFLP